MSKPVLWSAKELVKEIEQSTTRISELVKAIKEYSYMDRAPLQDVDVHQSVPGNTCFRVRLPFTLSASGSMEGQ